MLPRVNDVRRTTLPARHLTLGTNCGGSDGNSGVTANPALGVASDLLAAQGGTSILGETPEIYGAEHLLTRRAVSAAVAAIVAWASMIRTSTVPKRGWGRTSHHRNVGSGKARVRISRSTTSTYSE